MEENNNNQAPDLGPPRISFATFLLKLLAGGAGGVVGSAILLLIFILAGSLLNPITNFGDAEYISPIFIFILMVMVFLASTVGNILSTWLIALTERNKYDRISSAIYHVFIISVIIFLLMVPVYFLASSINISIIAYAVALHIVISAQVSALILEIVSDYKYALVGVYGITFSILLSATVMFGLSGIVESPQILLFAALPIVWGGIAFVQSIFTMLYSWIARMYDKDFLANDTVYGQDYGKTDEVAEDAPKKTKDEVGADFLRHN